jgi:3-oxo-5-alpha-steroid 4-dehydrogenase 1
MQWLTKWYGMGKTSVSSRLNLPGRIGWLTMEAPGALTLMYLMKVLPEQHGIDDLPWQNKVLAGLFVSLCFV